MRRSARRLGLLGLAVLLQLGWGAAGEASAQDSRTLRLRTADGHGERVSLEAHRGYAALPASVLERVGWTAAAEGSGMTLRLADRATVELTAGTPFFRWNDELLQLADPPYFFSERLYVPLQLVSGFLPRMLAETYDYDPRNGALTLLEPDLWSARATTTAPDASPAVPSSRERGPDADAAGAAGSGGGASGRRVVIIDPGHGGKDVGARGAAGIYEKEVALGVAKALARELEGDPTLEVHLTRSDDTFVPIWERGELATGWKGDRPGIFISLHANAAARSRSVRGFETYFLSEARTEHERRVAALENAPLEMEGPDGSAEAPADPDLGFILQDLRNSDTQHWSSVLAEEVQTSLDPVHPGPNRGVKQGPFAVITNALMPGVLVEMGFITNPAEARLMNRASFQEDAARALARAVRAFFERYPPGSDHAAGETR